jgi:DnaJ family protein A protein 5
MESENKRARETARKSYSEDVRSLVTWLKRRDPRVKEHQAAAAAKAAAAAEADKKRRDDEAAKVALQRATARAELFSDASLE